MRAAHASRLVAVMITILSNKLPQANDSTLTRLGEERWTQRAQESGKAGTMDFAAAALTDATLGPLLRGVFAHSPFLTQEMAGNIPFLREIAETGFDAAFDRVLTDLAALPVETLPTTAVMTALRLAKRKASLAAALADIAGAWDLDAVTGALSRIADMTLGLAVRHLLATPAFAVLPKDGAGLIVLGMGKLGAYELNYSSDIDLVIFYDDSQFDARRMDDIGPAFVRLARGLVRLMEERTGDGYVFRTDLRLRPDPGSTPLAVSLSAAEIYYGSMGQNWERAAMIKARQVAGDARANEALFAFLKPWIWRRNLDFAALEDIHSIKRQINLHRLKPENAGLLGHNVKLGRGGIREVELYAQTQQLIFGGRDASLRAPATCDALRALAAARRIEDRAADELILAYRFLRTVEHRLQMVDDRQTHILPETEAGMADIAAFMGFRTAAAFTGELRRHLECVQERFNALFARSPSLSGSGSLVFTGVEDDPDTLDTLTALGFTNVRAIAGAIRGWHHGRTRATRSERAREILTELTPALLNALAATAEPDTAFLRFDAFLAALPAGVMLLSLFLENPQFLRLTGRIMGMAPALAEQLSQTPAMFEELLSADFFDPLPAIAVLMADLDQALALATDYEDGLIRLRYWVAGKKFQAGVHILESITDGIAAGRFLADIAEAALKRLLPLVEAEFQTRHGAVEGGAFAIVALGRLGGRLMSFTSDLDLVTIYDAPEGAISDGPKPLDAPLYYTRLTQRLIAAITVPLSGGRLYAVDLRLRPSGEAGPVAASVSAFAAYHAVSAWTWEHMALTRARVIAGPPALTEAIEAIVRNTLVKPRDPVRLRSDVADMRRRIAGQFSPANRWDFKYAAGGLVDIEFTAQYLLLAHAPEDPGLLTTGTGIVIGRLESAGYLSPDDAADLMRALQLAWRVQGLIRLTTRGVFDPETAPGAIKAMVAGEVAKIAANSLLESVDFVKAETILDDILLASHRRFQQIVDPADPPQ